MASLGGGGFAAAIARIACRIRRGQRGSTVTQALAEERPGWVCNLASKEYYGVVREDELPCPAVHPVFQAAVLPHSFRGGLLPRP